MTESSEVLPLAAKAGVTNTKDATTAHSSVSVRIVSPIGPVRPVVKCYIGPRLLKRHSTSFYLLCNILKTRLTFNLKASAFDCGIAASACTECGAYYCIGCGLSQ